MSFTMWIAADWLKDFAPTARMGPEGGREPIDSVRILDENAELDSTTLYIGQAKDFYQSDSEQILCVNRNDVLFLGTTDLKAALNSVMACADMFSRWHADMRELEASGAPVSQLLSRTETLLGEPVGLFDSTQRPLAMSSIFSYGEVDETWDEMLAAGTAELEKIVAFNTEFSTAMMKRGVHLLENHAFSTRLAYHCSFFLGEVWLGAAVMIQREEPLSQGKVDLFTMLCQYFEQWFDAHAQQQSRLSIGSLLKLILSGQTCDYQLLERQLRRIGWEPAADKFLITMEHKSKQYGTHAHFCRALNVSLPSCYAIVHGGTVCVLCSTGLRNLPQLLEEVIPWIRRGGYYACYSDLFRDFTQAREAYLQTLSALSLCAREVGACCSYQDFAFQYGLTLLHRQMETRFIHPAVQILQDYDRRQKSQLSRTLETYLNYERIAVATAAYLKIHRHTLTYRLQQIDELIHCNLDDPLVRLHIQCSYVYSRLCP